MGKLDIFYVEEHINCCNYSKLNSKLQDNAQAIADYRYKSGEIMERIVSDTELVFVLDGECSLSTNGINSVTMGKGQVILVPIGQKYMLRANKDTHIMICNIPTNVELCNTYSMKQLYEIKAKIKDRGEFSLLEMNERLWTFAENVLDCVNDGLKCTKYISIKITELMFMFRLYYTKEDLANFFYPILNNDMEFANLIFENWAYVKNKADLAELSNLSPSRFGVKFKEVFGTSPYQWLINQRSERIYYELISTNNSLKQISENFKFRSVQHFNDFCKKQFGKTPGQIRGSAKNSANA